MWRGANAARWVRGNSALWVDGRSIGRPYGARRGLRGRLSAKRIMVMVWYCSGSRAAAPKKSGEEWHKHACMERDVAALSREWRSAATCGVVVRRKNTRDSG